MTVDVAAVAGRNPDDPRADLGFPTEAIVLVADRRLTLEDESVTETWVPKIRGMFGQGYRRRTTWSAVYSGTTTTIDEIKVELQADKYKHLQDTDKWPSLHEIMKATSEATAKVYARAYDAHAYRPFGLTRALVNERPGVWPLSRRKSSRRSLSAN